MGNNVANNDPVIGGIIADVYESVGKDGVVTVEKSKSSTTYYETTKGIKVDRGYASSLFINDQKRDECVLEDTYVLVCDGEINNILQIENILKPIITEGKKLHDAGEYMQGTLLVLNLFRWETYRSIVVH